MYRVHYVTFGTEYTSRDTFETVEDAEFFIGHLNGFGYVTRIWIVKQ